MTDILWRVMNIADRVRNMSYLSEMAVLIFGVVAVFGIVNCIFGYRLLRFWMMLFGFVIGAGLGFFGVYTYGEGTTNTYIGAMLVLGIILAIVAFLIYKVGVFVIGAGIGLVVSIYVLQPKTSAIFFLCILIGIGLGAAAMRWAREILIVGTSILGGVLAGVSLAKIGALEQFPYGIGLSILLAILGMLIQFAINKPEDDEDEEEEDEEYDRRRKRRHAEEHFDPDYDVYDDVYEDYEVEQPVERKKHQERKRPAYQAETSEKAEKTVRNNRQVDYKLDYDKALANQLAEECQQELKVEILKEFNKKNGER